ncbi:MAG: hypothetical protein IPP04_09715 [Saprospiraceae bacterium]|nr:hypothetical protein [Saprospiraceae bacterium]
MCWRWLKESALNFLLPVYLYNESAKSADRKNLGDLRSGEYEGLAQKLTTPTGQPDFGPSTMNERSGALIIGARKILIAYNINLNTKEVSIAKRLLPLARKNGGLAAVRAIGWYMPEYHCAQVSTNLVDIGQTLCIRYLICVLLSPKNMEQIQWVAN